MTTHRQAFIEELDDLTDQRQRLLKLIEAEICEPARNGLVFLLRLTDADIERNHKAIDAVDGKFSKLEFMRWYQGYLAVKQSRLAELRDSIEANRNNEHFDTPIGRSIFEMALQRVKDDVLQESHHREHVDAAMEKIDSMYPPAPKHPSGMMFKHYGRFTIRCEYIDNQLVVNANDTVAILRCLNGEMKRVVELYRYTPATQRFSDWIQNI